MTSPSLTALFAAFFRVGLTSFGMAILQNLKLMSLRRGFVTEAEIEEGLALVQLYPGPLMVDLVAYIGYRRRGPLGAVAATAGMLMPATLLMLVLSAAYQRWGDLPQVIAMLPGLGALVVGVILNVTLDFAQKNLKSQSDALLALLAFCVGAMGGNMVWAVGVGIAAGALLWRHERDEAIEKTTTRLPWKRLIVPLFLGCVLVLLALVAALNPGPNSQLLLTFMKIGSIAFGNGATILPIMQQAVVIDHQWLNPGQFSAAIAMGQITPGPILNSATFVGYQVTGVLGAGIATVAIFSPSVVMTMMFTELFVHVRHLAAVRGAIRGVMASFVGMLAWVTISLGAHVFENPLAWVMAGAALVALRYLKWDTLRIFGIGLLLWAAALQWGFK